ncbi:MAG: TRAP-type mannitol/chloroaromatic compound transport system permease small subunit [Planctomycetota bacterium]|jgi:TRAP-type mannitol/chloroaromatic compound transport system permease small subunit
MEQEILQKIEDQQVKIDAIYKSVEKTRKYFLVTLWGTVIMFVLPLIALAFVIPKFIQSYLSAFNGLL